MLKNTVLFLNQVKNKERYFPNYEVRITNNLHVTSGDWRFFQENYDNIGSVKLVVEISKNVLTTSKTLVPTPVPIFIDLY